MPTQLPPSEKQAFIDIVEAAPYPGGPIEAERLEDILNDYEDVYTAICRQLQLFAANNAYLTEAISVFDDTQLQNVGIWNNKTISSPPLVNPVMIINSTLDGEVIINSTSPPYYKALAILGNSTINRLSVLSGTYINELYIGPGSEVGFLDGANSGVIIGVIWLPFLKSTPSKLLAIDYQTLVRQIEKDPGSYFGGYTNYDPNNPCAAPVTNLAVALTTHNTVQLTWVPPSMQSPPLDYLFINIYFRKTGSNDWIEANDNTGIYNAESGYTFTNLESGTAYEFRIIVICKNGGWSSPEDVDATTACC